VRLNQVQALQALFTVSAALILYRSFPSELVVWLPEGYPPMHGEPYRCVERVARHMKSILANFQVYHRHIATIPLECFMLFEILYFAGCPKHSLHDLEISDEMSKILDQVIRMIITRLPQSQVPIAFFIHKSIMWLRNDARMMNLSSRTQKIAQAHNIAKSLASLSLTFPLESMVAIFPMLVATTILDALETIHRIPKTTTSPNGRWIILFTV